MDMTRRIAEMAYFPHKWVSHVPWFILLETGKHLTLAEGKDQWLFQFPEMV